MQKYMMFKDLKASTILYPSGTIKTRDAVKADYPIFGTELGVIGLLCEDDGQIGDMVRMFYYGDIYSFVDSYKNQGVVFTSEMTNTQKCDAITAFVNQPKTESE